MIATLLLKCKINDNRTKEIMIDKVIEIIESDNDIKGITINDKKGVGIDIEITKGDSSKKTLRNNVIAFNSKRKSN